MTDTALIFELTVNVSPGQGEVQKSGSFYDVKGTFVLDDQYSSAVHVRKLHSHARLFICLL